MVLYIFDNDVIGDIKNIRIWAYWGGKYKKKFFFILKILFLQDFLCVLGTIKKIYFFVFTSFLNGLLFFSETKFISKVKFDV